MSLLETLKSDSGVVTMAIITAVLIILVIYLFYKMKKLDARYQTFIKKIGNSNNIEQDLKNYMDRVEKIERQNSQLVRACDILDDNLKICIQKTGIVRYNAFRDTGSELSFALALLDRENNGVVLNGIYSRENSNIYAKPIENGIPLYKVSEEEEEAIQIALKNK